MASAAKSFAAVVQSGSTAGPPSLLPRDHCSVEVEVEFTDTGARRAHQRWVDRGQGDVFNQSTTLSTRLGVFCRELKRTHPSSTGSVRTVVLGHTDRSVILNLLLPAAMWDLEEGVSRPFGKGALLHFPPRFDRESEQPPPSSSRVSVVTPPLPFAARDAVGGLLHAVGVERKFFRFTPVNSCLAEVTVPQLRTLGSMLEDDGLLGSLGALPSDLCAISLRAAIHFVHQPFADDGLPEPARLAAARLFRRWQGRLPPSCGYCFGFSHTDKRDCPAQGPFCADPAVFSTRCEACEVFGHSAGDSSCEAHPTHPHSEVSLAACLAFIQQRQRHLAPTAASAGNGRKRKAKGKRRARKPAAPTPMPASPAEASPVSLAAETATPSPRASRAHPSSSPEAAEASPPVASSPPMVSQVSSPAGTSSDSETESEVFFGSPLSAERHKAALLAPATPISQKINEVMTSPRQPVWMEKVRQWWAARQPTPRAGSYSTPVTPRATASPKTVSGTTALRRAVARTSPFLRFPKVRREAASQ